MAIILFFIDGLGLGENNPEKNPFARYKTAFFDDNFRNPLTYEAVPFISDTISLYALDATLGVEGLPQSATGQTALFTGVNAAQIMNRHIQAFPGPQLTKIIQEHGVIKKIRETGLSATSANLYSTDYAEQVIRRKRRHSATTLTILGAGLPLRSLPEMEAGRAVYHDITNELLPSIGITDIPVIHPKIAARRLAGLANDYDFVLFEYFLTDRYGHKQTWSFAEKTITILDVFLTALKATINSETIVILTSDHGNFEDLSVKTHTLNPVPLLVFGQKAKEFPSDLSSITEVAPAIFSTLKRSNYK